jgi:hypothetical protein
MRIKLRRRRETKGQMLTEILKNQDIILENLANVMVGQYHIRNEFSNKIKETNKDILELKKWKEKRERRTA